MPNSLSLDPGPEMPPMSEDLARKVQAQVKKTHGWQHELWTVMMIYNAARTVLSEEQGL